MKKVLIILLAVFMIIGITPVSAEDTDAYENEIVESEYIVYPEDKKNTVQNMTMTTINGTRTKVTADFVGPCTITYGEAYTVSNTWSVSFSASVKSFIIARLTANFSVSYNSTASSSSSFSVTYSIPSGYTGAVYFTPYIYRFNYVYVDNEAHGYRATTTWPKKVGNFCDGKYEKIQWAN